LDRDHRERDWSRDRQIGDADGAAAAGSEPGEAGRAAALLGLGIDRDYLPDRPFELAQAARPVPPRGRPRAAGVASTPRCAAGRAFLCPSRLTSTGFLAKLTPFG